MSDLTKNNTQDQLNTTPASANGEQTHEPERFATPVVDIYETADGLRVLAEMPGLEREHISISVEKDVLTLKGVVQSAAPQAEVVYQEFEPVSYFRQFRLGSKINQNQIGAEYRNGVLNVLLPFAEETKPRQIQVQVA